MNARDTYIVKIFLDAGNTGIEDSDLQYEMKSRNCDLQYQMITHHSGIQYQMIDSRKQY
jgi:hypothetical protein